MIYRKCAYCGAALDPGETCDCKMQNDDKNEHNGILESKED